MLWDYGKPLIPLSSIFSLPSSFSACSKSITHRYGNVQKRERRSLLLDRRGGRPLPRPLPLGKCKTWRGSCITSGKAKPKKLRDFFFISLQFVFLLPYENLIAVIVVASSCYFSFSSTQGDYCSRDNSWKMTVSLIGSSSIGFRYGVLDGKLLLFQLEGITCLLNFVIRALWPKKGNIFSKFFT